MGSPGGVHTGGGMSGLAAGTHIDLPLRDGTVHIRAVNCSTAKLPEEPWSKLV